MKKIITENSFKTINSNDALGFFDYQSDSLSTDSKLAINKYTEDGYIWMNNYKRNSDDTQHLVNNHQKKMIKNIDDSLSNSTLKENITVFRLTNSSFLPDDLKIGDVFTDMGYISTTVSESFANSLEFDGDTKMILEIPKGSEGLYVEKYSSNGYEKELLLPPSSFKITKIESNNFKLTMRMLSDD